MEAPPAHPVWIAILAAVGGLVIPAIAAIAAAVLLGPPSVAHSSQLAKLAGAALTVAEAIFAGLGAAALVEAGWRRIGLPGSGPANFLPLRYIRHRLANKKVKELIDQLRDSPAQPSRESLHALLDLSRELARRDIYTRAHSGRVSRLCVELGQRIGLSPEDCEIARLAGLLHDIGKLEIPAAILNKPGPLDPDEAELVRNHPAIGAALVAPYIGADVVNAVRHHHERVDGAGYPDGVDSDALPIIARLVPVVDTYDALISDRSYRPGRSREEAFLEMRAVAGTQLDAELVDALIEMESAKVPFGGAVLGLAPVGALLRRAEHLLHNSAAPAAAAITAIAVAGAGWLGVMSGSGGSAASANTATPPKVVQSVSPHDSPSPEISTSPPASALPIVTTSPTPPAQAQTPTAPIVVYSGSKSGGGTLYVPPKITKTNGTTTTTKTTKTGTGTVTIPPSNNGGSKTPSNNPTTAGPSPSPTKPGQSPPPPTPPPTISSISPTSGPVDQAVTINGTNLSGVSVAFGAWGAAIKSTGSTSMVVFAPPGSGTVPIVATNPSSGASSSNVLGVGDSYTYVGPNVASISDDGTPASGSDAFGAAGSTLTITGSNLSNATSVTVGGAPCPVTNNPATMIQCTVPSGSAQRGAVLVSTPAGGPASPSSGGEFNYGPNLVSVTPASGVAGTPVTISGSNLSAVNGVTFDGVAAASFSVQDDATVIATAPAPKASGAQNIQVTNPAGSSATGKFDRFTWNPPAISSLSTTSGLPGTPVTISGSGFTGVSAVKFGTTSATFTLINDDSITTSVPAITAGGSDAVTVKTPSGTSGASAFTVEEPPTISGISPDNGPTQTATSVVISGSNLSGATSVTFGGAAATITGNTATSVTVTAPLSDADASVDVIVQTPSGQATSPTQFTYTG
ncbi:MAG: IPT/TIG domain-containing protein [Actinomycetota bacterium]